MCGRFSITSDLEELRERFGAEPPQNYEIRYNAAPGQILPVIEMGKPDEMQMFKWGLIPHWAKDPAIGTRLINARAETIAQKPAFRSAFQKHRCLIPADGFYEWDKTGPKKIPYRVTLKSKELFTFAGICDSWIDDEGKEINTFSIITTEANALIAKIHRRMPVILTKEDETKWLNSQAKEEDILKLLRAYPSDALDIYPVSTLINNPRHDSPEVINPV